MTSDTGLKREALQRRVLDWLIQQQGLREGDYALFFVTGEDGTVLVDPSGSDAVVEEESGYVVDRQGRIFSFWLGRDPEQKTPTLVEWEPVNEEPQWRDHEEYRRARAAVGLNRL
jgi:hypothetical protein